MFNTTRKSAEVARNQFANLLHAAESGRSTIITKHGRPVAALVPFSEFVAGGNQHSLMSLEGSGRGLWGKRSARTIRAFRDEWSR